MQSIFDRVQEMGHEQEVFCHDPYSGLNAIIAIHNTTLGPALGGTRVWNYGSHEDALIDALRLSRGMTYKNAISGLNIGGGKAVIIADPSMKSEALWRRYGRFVNSLNGKYITAEDVNTNTSDMEFVSLETKFVTGVPEYAGGSGDPSPFTARGVYMGMKASAKKAYGNDSLAGKKVLVQGAGHVGQYLIGHLVEEGAKVMVSDIDQAKLKSASEKYRSIEVVDNATIFDLDMDIYAPCALGATVNDETISKLKCSIIAGAANNQLADENIHGPLLVKKGILYGPDFLINAGGVINVSAELDGYNIGKVNSAVEKIYERTLDIYTLAEKENTHPQAAAMIMAQKRIDDIAKMKSRM
ncbi:MAG TPA: Glu/Leu/Phe/Val dehydrogenase dimerization domain-containing protein [Chitinophagaceae bacterium]|nr:Glu/Leu/Phe/Val dehydrogenase dimerization domain-containing protein [Chitinophagaceae bacterium]